MNFNPWYYHSTEIFIQLLRKVFSFNRNIHLTSTQTFLIRNKYSFNFNTNLFRSTELFVPAGCKLYATQHRTCILKLTFCKFPDIPNNIHSTKKNFIQQTRPVPPPHSDVTRTRRPARLMFLNAICRPFICFERVFYS